MTLEQRADHLAQLMRERLGIPGKGLEEKFARSERVLPAHIHDKLALIVKALQQSRHPKLSRQVDMKPVEAASHDVERYLESISPWKRRWKLLVDHLADAAIGILIMIILVVLVLIWRGFL